MLQLLQTVQIDMSGLFPNFNERFDHIRIPFFRMRFQWKKNTNSWYICVMPAAALSAEHSAPNQRIWVRGSPVEIPPCTLMAPGSYKIRRGCNVLQVLIQIIPLGVPKRGSHPYRGGSKLWSHVFGPSLGMSARLLALATV